MARRHFVYDKTDDPSVAQQSCKIFVTGIRGGTGRNAKKRRCTGQFFDYVTRSARGGGVQPGKQSLLIWVE